MSTTRLADLIIPELWTPNFMLEDPILVSFFNSGMVVNDPVLSALAQGEGETFNVRHLNDLANVEENSSSDDPDDKSTPQKVTSGGLIARKVMRNQSWSSMDLAAALHDPDPVKLIRSRIAAYWVKRYQAYMTSVLVGIKADNVANDDGDMVHDAQNVISGDAILEAKATMGDSADELATIAMHSIPYLTLQKQNLITTLRDSDANVEYEKYLNYRVIVNDNLPVTNVGGTNVFTSVLFANGVFSWGTGSPKVPTELKRDADAGGGEGQETIFNRQHWIGQPKGFSCTTTAFNPNNTELAKAESWTRSYDRKQAPIVFLDTTG